MIHLLVLLAAASAAAPADRDAEPSPEAFPVVPLDDGTGVRAVTRLQAFRATTPLVYDHLAGRPEVREGWLLVAEVKPELARPRQVANPVLYVGDTPVMLLARDPATGCVAGLLPAKNLADEPVGFGSAEPPERVDPARGAAERAALVAAGVRPRPAGELARATASVPLSTTADDLLRLAHGACAAQTIP
jgi:hypothetical protein